MRFFRSFASVFVIIAVAIPVMALGLPAHGWSKNDMYAGVWIAPQTYTAPDFVPAALPALGRDAFSSTVLDIVSWPVVDAGASISDCFGCRGGSHNGTDMTPGGGTPVMAIARGTVVQAGANGTFGYSVILESVVQGQNVQSLYGHMVAPPNVGVGQVVGVGTTLGYVGCTGSCTGNHLHIEIRVNGGYVDPLAWLQSNVNDYLWQ